MKKLLLITACAGAVALVAHAVYKTYVEQAGLKEHESIMERWSHE